MMFGPTQVAASISTRVVESLDLGDLAAHDPGDAARALGVADERHLRAEAALDAVERRHRLALVRAPDDDPASAHLVEIERVQRLTGREHHVVRDVDDVRDRPLARRHQPLLEPQRRGADLDVLEDARREAQADLRVDLDRRVVVRASRRPRARRRARSDPRRAARPSRRAGRAQRRRRTSGRGGSG